MQCELVEKTQRSRVLHCVQVLLMVLILLTGNYNFFNIVTIFLCLSLVDDDWVMGWSACTAAVRAGTGLVFTH